MNQKTSLVDKLRSSGKALALASALAIPASGCVKAVGYNVETRPNGGYAISSIGEDGKSRQVGTFSNLSNGCLYSTNFPTNTKDLTVCPTGQTRELYSEIKNLGRDVQLGDVVLTGAYDLQPSEYSSLSNLARQFATENESSGGDGASGSDGDSGGQSDGGR